MIRQLAGLLMIYFISGRADTEIVSNFKLIKKICEWDRKIFDVIEQQQKLNESQLNIEIIDEHVNQILSEIDSIEAHMNIKLGVILKMLLDDIRQEISYDNLKEKFVYCFSAINKYFHQARNYKIGGAYNNQILKDFAHKALWSSGSVPDLLDDMYEVFFPDGVKGAGLLSVMLESALLNIVNDCNTFVSPQQKIYYIYIQVLITEMKALIIQIQSLMIQQYFEISYNYTSELKRARTNFRKGLKNFHALFIQTISQYPQQVRRCEGNPPARGDNFIELLNFSRIDILDRNFMIERSCLACPEKSILDDYSRSMNTMIENCKTIGTSLTTCLAKSGSPHEYLWWEDEVGNHYGPHTNCEKQKKIHAGFVKTPPYGTVMGHFVNCELCVCSVETNGPQNDSSTIWRVSVTNQYSDYYNNKVVTGVRFVIKDNALHLQIRQGQFTHGAMVHDKNQWKNLELGYYSSGTQQMKGPMFFEPLRHNRKTLYLDDIKAPDGYAVTGVRLKLIDDFAFELQIHVSEFELDTGEIFPFGGGWIDASIHPMSPNDYKRKRSEINMGKSNDPTRSSGFKYDLQSNRLIKFTHTDIDKDAGQTTIPLIDSQSAETVPPFPLGGIGISFRGKDGFGGYVVPFIYTLDVLNYIRPLDIKEIPTTSECD